MMTARLFKTSEEWAVLSEWIRLRQAQAMSGCINAKTHEEKEYHRGVLDAFNDMASAPEELFAADPLDKEMQEVEKKVRRFPTRRSF